MQAAYGIDSMAETACADKNKTLKMIAQALKTLTETSGQHHLDLHAGTVAVLDKDGIDPCP